MGTSKTQDYYAISISRHKIGLDIESATRPLPFQDLVHFLRRKAKKGLFLPCPTRCIRMPPQYLRQTYSPNLLAPQPFSPSSPPHILALPSPLKERSLILWCELESLLKLHNKSILDVVNGTLSSKDLFARHIYALCRLYQHIYCVIASKTKIRRIETHFIQDSRDVISSPRDQQHYQPLQTENM